MNRESLAVRRRSFLAAMLVPASAHGAPEFGIVHPSVCLAGEWGRGHPEHRVQLAVVSTIEAAQRAVKQLEARHVKAEHYTALWLVRGDEEPQVVVEARVYGDAAEARARARRVRQWVRGAFARHYLHYR